MLVAALCVLSWSLRSPLDRNELAGGDEGSHGVLARNLLASPAQCPAPSITPLGPPGDEPPPYPALSALCMRVLGPKATAVRLLSMLSAFVMLLASAPLARRRSRFVHSTPSQPGRP